MSTVTHLRWVRTGLLTLVGGSTSVTAHAVAGGCNPLALATDSLLPARELIAHGAIYAGSILGVTLASVLLLGHWAAGRRVSLLGLLAVQVCQHQLLSAWDAANREWIDAAHSRVAVASMTVRPAREAQLAAWTDSSMMSHHAGAMGGGSAGWIQPMMLSHVIAALVTAAAVDHGTNLARALIIVLSRLLPAVRHVPSLPVLARQTNGTTSGTRVIHWVLGDVLATRGPPQGMRPDAVRS